MPLDWSFLTEEKILPMSQTVPIPAAERARQGDAAACMALAQHGETDQAEHHKERGQPLERQQLEADVGINVVHIGMTHLEVRVRVGVAAAEELDHEPDDEQPPADNRANNEKKLKTAEFRTCTTHGVPPMF